MLDKNRDALNVLENEAMDFVEDTYKKYKQKKHLHFVTSFSGGKDSQVVLDLVSRIIPPDEYKKMKRGGYDVIDRNRTGDYQAVITS